MVLPIQKGLPLPFTMLLDPQPTKIQLSLPAIQGHDLLLLAQLRST